MATALEQAIDTSTTDWRMRLALRIGALLEGGSLGGPWSSGDNGVSHGPYQINSTVHAVSKAQANDPVYAVNYMRASYQAGVNRVTQERPGLWQSDPAQAAALAAYYAERPAAMYPAARVAAAFNAVKSWFTGSPQTGESDGGEIVPVVLGIPNPLDGIGDLFDGLGTLLNALRQPDTWIRVIAVLAGAVLLVAGAFLAVS